MSTVSLTEGRTRTVDLTIDGREVTVPEGTTIWTAARDAGIDIPVLCHDERYDPVGVCRMCVVDVGGRALRGRLRPPLRGGHDGHDVHARGRAPAARCSPSCWWPTSRRANETRSRRRPATTCCSSWPTATGWPPTARLPRGSGRGTDLSNPVIAVDHDACILCDRCVRACDDIQGNDVIGRSGKGYSTRIAFDLNDPMGASSCVTCGECVAACPTGALTNKPIRDIPIRPRTELDAVESVCPYCGVGCALTYYVDRERGAIAFAEGRDQPGSQGRLCVKGRYGWDYAASPQRLTTPLIRREDSYPKGPLSAEVRGEDEVGRKGRQGRRPGGLVPMEEVLPHFREATWEEALDLVARRLHGDPRRDAVRPRSPASGRRSAPTRRPTCSRSSSAPASTPTTSTTAPGCATRPASRPSSRASAPGPCPRRTATW